MFGLSKVAIQAIVAALVLAAGFGSVSCFGKSRYEQGQIAGRIAAREANSKVVLKAIDSTRRAIEPTLSALVRANDSLSAANAELQRRAESATARALRADAVLRGLPDSVRLHADARLVAALDSLSASNVDLLHVVDDLSRSNVALRSRADSALSVASELQRLQALTRAQVDSAQRTIKDLRKLKDPPRCGFKCGVVSTLGVLVAIVATLHFAGQ